MTAGMNLALYFNLPYLSHHVFSEYLKLSSIWEPSPTRFKGRAKISACLEEKETKVPSSFHRRVIK